MPRACRAYLRRWIISHDIMPTRDIGLTLRAAATAQRTPMRRAPPRGHIDILLFIDILGTMIRRAAHLRRTRATFIDSRGYAAYF